MLTARQYAKMVNRNTHAVLRLILQKPQWPQSNHANTHIQHIEAKQNSKHFADYTFKCYFLEQKILSVIYVINHQKVYMLPGDYREYLECFPHWFHYKLKKLFL